MHMLGEHVFELLFRCVSHPFLQDVSLCIEQVHFRLVVKAERTLEIVSARVIGVKIRELDFAEILCFEPMDHGRHRAAGSSGKAEEFDELQSAGCQADGGGVGGVKVWSA